MVGPVTVRVNALDSPPPGAGVKTVIAAVPPVARSAAVIGAVTCVADPNVVVRARPLTWTTDAATKPVPVTVSVNAGLPAARLAGFSVAIVGTGLATVTIALVASRVNVLFAYHRTWQVAPTVVGATNVTVAPVSPTAGGVLVPFKYA